MIGVGVDLAWGDGLGDGLDVFRGAAAAATHHIDQTCVGESADHLRHVFGRFVVLPQLVRQAGIGVDADGHVGHRGELDDQFAKPQLDRGLRFGFIANSDSHGLLWHHGECRKRDPFRTGLTAVISATRTREAIEQRGLAYVRPA